MHQLQLTIADLVLETHDTHHPLGPTLYYEQQRPAAKRRTHEFLVQRLPQNSADTKIGLPERFQNVIGILNEIGKANGEVTVATEISAKIRSPGLVSCSNMRAIL